MPQLLPASPSCRALRLAARRCLSVGCLLGLASGVFAPAAWAADAPAAAAPAAKTAPAATPGPGADKAPAATAAQAKKTVGALVNAIRFDKRALGEKHLGFATMAEHLLGPAYATMASADRSQFIADFKLLLVNTAFPKGHDLFRYLDGVLYGQAQQDKGRITLPSTIVVHRNVKKTEMQVQWVLVPEDGALKVVDVVSMGDSTCDGIRDEEVAPLLREGGVAKLLAALRQRAEAAAKQGAK